MCRMAQATATNGFVQRLIGAMAMDVAIYEEVEADSTATLQALGVVVLSSGATGIGAMGFGAAASQIPAIVAIALMTWAA